MISGHKISDNVRKSSWAILGQMIVALTLYKVGPLILNYNSRYWHSFFSQQSSIKTGQCKPGIIHAIIISMHCLLNCFISTVSGDLWFLLSCNGRCGTLFQVTVPWGTNATQLALAMHVGAKSKTHTCTCLTGWQYGISWKNSYKPSSFVQEKLVFAKMSIRNNNFVSIKRLYAVRRKKMTSYTCPCRPEQQ